MKTKLKIKISVKEEYKKLLDENNLEYVLEDNIPPEVLMHKIKKEAIDKFFNFEIEILKK